ncbi:aldose 1-epimerase [Chitinophaga sp. 22321]|uniref:Aldose 1-epimerase n=1 Tax=Chitinophaga hostae TaxID=2831022 RepID=A0ABS5IVQ2_9BACT|nr:aldose 1-epimerase [Chitinophaga hostae]MBS0026841.1 aldose 1-epimerase [Chitinophaga hostae]
MKFGIRSFQEAGFDIIALQDLQTGTQVEIIPAYGALLHAFKVKRGEETLNLIDSYKDLADLEANLRSSFKSVKLSPYACRIKDAKYSWEGSDYSIQKTIAPGNAIHGLLYDAAFTVTAQEANDQQAAITLTHHFKQTDDAGYPFAYDCIATFTLHANNELQLSTKVVNQSNTVIPVMDGWHPYFTTGTPVDELELTFASKQIVEFNEKLLPTGNLLPYTEFVSGKLLKGVELDNSFLLDQEKPQPQATIHDPKKNINIAFYPGNNYPILQIYIPPHRTSIAVENLSGAPDAFNNGIGLVQLAAGESRVFDTRIRITL